MKVDRSEGAGEDAGGSDTPAEQSHSERQRPPAPSAASEDALEFEGKKLYDALLPGSGNEPAGRGPQDGGSDAKGSSVLYEASMIFSILFYNIQMTIRWGITRS